MIAGRHALVTGGGSGVGKAIALAMASYDARYGPTLLGFASHAPGSLGVFDAAMLVALPEFGREQLLATLVVFRILYFMIPFGIAISIMGCRELWLNVVLPWQQRRKLNGAFAASAASSAAARSSPCGTTREMTPRRSASTASKGRADNRRSRATARPTWAGRTAA